MIRTRWVKATSSPTTVNGAQLYSSSGLRICGAARRFNHTWSYLAATPEGQVWVPFSERPRPAFYPTFAGISKIPIENYYYTEIQCDVSKAKLES